MGAYILVAPKRLEQRSRVLATWVAPG